MINGALTVQAFPAAKSSFVRAMHTRIDALDQIHFSSFAVHGWISVCAACLSSVFYFAIGLLALRLRDNILPGIFSALLLASRDIMLNNQKALDGLAEVQRGTNCVERLTHYANDIEQERAWRNPNVKPDWPANGTIEVHQVSMRY